jgi:FMN phosphatase YigB (HAD superfamily)
MTAQSSSSLSGIRCLTLDWGDTLAVNYGMPYLATQRHAFDRLAAALNAAGCRVRPDFTAAAMAELGVQWRLSVDVQRNPEHREFDFQLMISGWVDATLTPGCDRAAAQQAQETCKDRLTDTVLLFTETAPVLRELKRRGLRLGILSHVPWPGDAVRRWFARHGLADLIDFYSLSCEIGWIKPNPRHFEHAIAHAGVDPKHILHVGDHPLRDVEGARAMGMRTCLRITENVYPDERLAGCAPDCTILHLADLLELCPSER